MASPLSNKELALFESLRKDKQEDSKTFSKSSNRGLWKTIIEQYPESAHFVYELLQNANDAKATYVEIVISDKGLIFKHNGAVQFSVTPLDAKPVGHINSITSIGDSSKDGMNTIGKFGIGFKSVFTYTNAPEIYDDKFWFRIDNYIVPSLLANDHPARKKGETLFWLPFKSGEENKCYKDVIKKISSLDNPILFLDHLKSVLWRDTITGQSSQYKKEIKETHNIGDILCELTSIQNSQEECKIWMFHRDVELEHTNRLHRISVGYYLKEDKGRHVIDTNVNPKVFCFFPTSEKFEQKRVMHAPFLLTASRSEILKDNSHNENLIEELAKLSADSLVCVRDIGLRNKELLINENLLDLVHIPRYYYDEYAKFSEQYIRVIKNNNLIITKGGKYTSTTNARIAQPIRIQKIFSDKQLTAILGHDTTLHFAFPAISSYDYYKKEYLLADLGVQICDTKKIAQSITPQFMSEQNDSWLHKFYAFIKEEAKELWNSSSSGALLRYAPIIRTNKKKFVAPYDKDALNIFYITPNFIKRELLYVDPNLLSNETTKKFLDELGIKEYDKKATITQILVRYEKGGSIDNDVLRDDLCFIYDYCSNEASHKERSSLITDITKRLNVVYMQNGKSFYGPISQVYDARGNEDYFAGNKEIKVLNYDFYKEVFDKYQESNVLHFLHELGLKRRPCVESKSVYEFELSNQQRQLIKQNRSTRGYTIYDKEMCGLKFALNHHLNKSLSLKIWQWISEITDSQTDWHILKYSYFFYAEYTGEMESSMLHLLKSVEWVYIGDETKGFPGSFSRQQLRDAGYKGNDKLFDLLGVKTTWEDSKDIPDEVKKYASLGKRCKDEGISESEYDEMIKLYKDHKSRKTAKSRTEFDKKDNLSPKESLREADADEMFAGANRDKKEMLKQKNTSSKFELSPYKESAGEQMEKFIERQDRIREQEQHIANLRDKAEASPKYSKEWFEVLLELEYKCSKEDITAVTSKAISISFQRVEKEKGSDRIFVLKNPAKPIPLGIEEVGGITVKFQFSNKDEIEFSFEVASVRDFTLRLKAKIVDIDLLDEIDWTRCTLAEININNPVELIGKLRGAFAQLDLPDGYNLKDNIRDDIEFIFGPPGTGKTTYLSKYITRLIDENANCKILVLAPTNKACDVLTTKVMSTASCDSWLRRFVACGDQSIANKGLLCDRDSDIYNKTQCCVVSTIARLPYDGFDNPRVGLRDVEWDYVIIDEASMIPIAQIVYAIYKFAAAKVIIAGDPFQISPIVREESWKDENIYTMVNLNSFTNPRTDPHQFKIINLDTQYRSLPAVGTLFSEYAYNGMLKHYRHGEKPCDLVLDGIDISAINFIPFRVEKYDSIYGPRKLGGSNVQIYSVLLAVEFVKYMSKQWFEKHEPEEFLRIGVICPYAAQSQLIDTMLQQRREVYPNIDVVAGTIHGFQGDECDVIITVLNTPKGLKIAPDKMFIERKNILNVAISRARDYLFVLIPHVDTDGYENLNEIQSIGSIANKKCRTDLSIINADVVEGVIFNDSAFIEKNTFVTSHQMANVYTDAQKLYEVRIDENAVDIQINSEFE